ncbi:MAG: hypothetical protein Q9166_001382 [cf. Caloplaca sp. 2 TL-2023]
MSTTKTRIVVIVGVTGTGKSRLAVALAERFDGEIINGDALQMYEGLPIATNKLPFAERQSIPHHLLGSVKLDAEPWTVKKYVRDATAIIGEVIARGKLPIVVGGTHYYTQSLLFESSLVNETPTEPLPAEAQEEKWPILAASTMEMLDHLHAIDPEIASRWHPNDRRKIRHSLEVYLTSGKQPSDLYREQRKTCAASRSSKATSLGNSDQEVIAAHESTSSVRFDPLLLWIYADFAQLPARLDQRVDKMVQNGLIQEVESMQHYLQQQERSGVAVDQSSGIWTAIGFKELLPYVSASAAGELPIGDQEPMKKQGIELTKTATRQYARQQQRWIRGKLLRALEENGVLERMVVLDGTELSQWPQNVEAVANDAVSAFLSGDPLPREASPSRFASDVLVPKAEPHIKARYCEICKMTLMTQKEWDAHPKSKKHRKATRKPIDWQALYPKFQGQNNVYHTGSAAEHG